MAGSWITDQKRYPLDGTVYFDRIEPNLRRTRLTRLCGKMVAFGNLEYADCKLTRHGALTLFAT